MVDEGSPDSHSTDLSLSLWIYENMASVSV